MADGDKIEITVDVLRHDIRTYLPQLRELDEARVDAALKLLVHEVTSVRVRVSVGSGLGVGKLLVHEVSLTQPLSLSLSLTLTLTLTLLQPQLYP